MYDNSEATQLQALHYDLRWKYNNRGDRLERIWSSLTLSERTLRTSGTIRLQHHEDSSLGNLHNFIPEWNFADIVESRPETFLKLLKHHTTYALFEQCPADPEDAKLGDPGCSKPSNYIDIYLYLFKSLNIVVDRILGEESLLRHPKECSKPSNKTTRLDLSKSFTRLPPTNTSIPGLLASAQLRRDSLQDYTTALRKDPLVLAHAIEVAFFSRPETVADSNGDHLNVIYADGYIGPVFLETIHAAFEAVAVWNYLSCLLTILSLPSTDELYRAIILQEISSVCALEYYRMQVLFKRHVQTGMGEESFSRIPGVYDENGNAQVAMTGPLEELTPMDPRHHYVLRLCQPETDAFEASDWMVQLVALYEEDPAQQGKMSHREAKSLNGLGVVVAFIRDLTRVVELPFPSRNCLFVNKSRDLSTELNQMKKEIDLRKFVVPISNLLELGEAEAAFNTVDAFIAGKTGATIDDQYRNLIGVCIEDIQAKYNIEAASAEVK